MKDVLLIAHKSLVPPDGVKDSEVDRFKTPWVAEFDVLMGLRKLGHKVEILGVDMEISPLIEMIKNKRPDLVFNMLEQFNNDPAMDYHIVTLLELHGLTYTGCAPKGLLLGRDKALSKKILSYHGISTPKFLFFDVNEAFRPPKKMSYPMIVKCAFEEASYGIAKASVVYNEEKLRERVHYIQKELGQSVIVEEFIEGREIYVGVLGNKKLKTLPAWELKYENVERPEKEVYTERAKWNENYRERKGIIHEKAELTKDLEKKIQKICKRAYKALELTGYARVDLRLSESGKAYVLEVNPNPNIASDDEFAQSALSAGLSYEQLLEAVIRASQRPPRQT